MKTPRLRRLRILRRSNVDPTGPRGMHIYIIPNLFTTGNMFFGFLPMHNYFVLAMALLLAFVMVSTFRYRSFKDMDFRQRKPFSILIIGLVILVFIAIKPEVHLFIAFITYAVLGAILGIISPARKKL